jgi:ribosomal protein L29
MADEPTIPKWRYDELAEKHRGLEGEIAALRKQVESGGNATAELKTVREQLATTLAEKKELERTHGKALEALTARLTELIDKDVSVSCFAGIPLPISKPPFRHLMTPHGNKPLFAAPTAELEADETGYLGVDPIHVFPPSSIQAPVKARPAEDEFFDDEVSDTIDVFNRMLPDPDS